MLLLAALIAACGKDASPTGTTAVDPCDARVAAVPSVVSGRLLVGYTPYGPNWVTPEITRGVRWAAITVWAALFAEQQA